MNSTLWILNTSYPEDIPSYRSIESFLMAELRLYVAGEDRVLCQQPGDLNFKFSYHLPTLVLEPNPFLIIINADIKFRRYFRQEPLDIPLPDDIFHLMRRTMDLVELIYWEPEIRRKSSWLGLREGVNLGALDLKTWPSCRMLVGLKSKRVPRVQYVSRQENLPIAYYSHTLPRIQFTIHLA